MLDIRELFEKYKKGDGLDLSELSDVMINSGLDGVKDIIDELEDKCIDLTSSSNKIEFLREYIDYDVFSIYMLDDVLAGLTPFEICRMMNDVEFKSDANYFGINEVWNELCFWDELDDIDPIFEELNDFLDLMDEELEKQKELFFDEEKQEEWNYKQNAIDELGNIYLY